MRVHKQLDPFASKRMKCISHSYHGISCTVSCICPQWQFFSAILVQCTLILILIYCRLLFLQNADLLVHIYSSRINKYGEYILNLALEILYSYSCRNSVSTIYLGICLLVTAVSITRTIYMCGCVPPEYFNANLWQEQFQRYISISYEVMINVQDLFRTLLVFPR